MKHQIAGNIRILRHRYIGCVIILGTGKSSIQSKNLDPFLSVKANFIYKHASFDDNQGQIVLDNKTLVEGQKA